MKSICLDSVSLKNWIKSLFIASGITETDSHTLADSLVLTSLWGIDSHGVERVPHYLARIKNKTINVLPKIQFRRTASSTGMLDGDDGHGIVIMMKAVEHVFSLAKESGVGAVGVFNSSHCGAIGLYTRKLAKEGLIGIAFTHADSLVKASGGNKAFFGTNPISLSFPSKRSDSQICLDMATSEVPWNRIINARLNGQKVPFGLGVDIDGKDSDDPNQIVAVKPIGGYKGFGLGMVIDILCGPLTGMNYGPTMTSMYRDLNKVRKLGSFVIAIDPDKFIGRSILIDTIEKMLLKLKELNPDTLYPGEPEQLTKQVREKEGIPLSERAVKDFVSLSGELKVEIPARINI